MHGRFSSTCRVPRQRLGIAIAVALAAARATAADEPLFGPPPLAGEYAAQDFESGVRYEPLGPAMDAPTANQLWLINTRRLPRAGRRPGNEPPPEVARYAEGEWSPASLAELNAAYDPRLATVLLVHGNHTDEATAIAKGHAAYRTLTEPAPDARPLRLLVWSWPTDFIPGTVRRDARVKAEWAEDEAFYLARFVTGLDPRESVTLVGYSFGSRAISGALHLLGGGSLDGRRLTNGAADERAPLRAVLLAAAVDDDWLLPGHRHGRALAAVERMVVTVNPQDRVLRWYRFLVPRSQATALGSHGIGNRAALGRHAQKLVQLDARQAVGGQHGWAGYIGSPEVVAQLRRELVVSSTRRHRTASRP